MAEIRVRVSDFHAAPARYLRLVFLEGTSITIEDSGGVVQGVLLPPGRAALLGVGGLSVEPHRVRAGRKPSGAAGALVGNPRGPDGR